MLTSTFWRLMNWDMLVRFYNSFSISSRPEQYLLDKHNSWPEETFVPFLAGSHHVRCRCPINRQTHRIFLEHIGELLASKKTCCPDLKFENFSSDLSFLYLHLQDQQRKFIKFACNQERLPSRCSCQDGSSDVHVPPYPMKIGPPDGRGKAWNF